MGGLTRKQALPLICAAALAVVAFAQPAHAAIGGGTSLVGLSGTGGSINYTDYPGPGLFEFFTNTEDTSLFLPTISSIAPTTPSVPVGAQVFFQLNFVDSGSVTGHSAGDLENLNGSGSFIMSLANPIGGKTTVLSGELSNGEIIGALGGSSATIAFTVSSMKSDFLNALPATDFLVLGGSVSPLIDPVTGAATPAKLTLTNDFSNCAALFTSCVQYIAPFALDWGASVTNTLPTGGVPEPASWATMLLGAGLVGGAARRRRRAAALNA